MHLADVLCQLREKRLEAERAFEEEVFRRAARLARDTWNDHVNQKCKEQCKRLRTIKSVDERKAAREIERKRARKQRLTQTQRRYLTQVIDGNWDRSTLRVKDREACWKADEHDGDARDELYDEDHPLCEAQTLARDMWNLAMQQVYGASSVLMESGELHEHLARRDFAALKGADKIAVEITRLNDGGLADEILQQLQVKFPTAFEQLGFAPPGNVNDACQTTDERLSEEPSKERIPLRASTAYRQYAETATRLKLVKPTDRDVYDALKSTLRRTGEESSLPSFDAWSRNLREYRRRMGQSKNTRRAGRAEQSRSFVTIDQIDPEQAPSRISTSKKRKSS